MIVKYFPYLGGTLHDNKCRRVVTVVLTNLAALKTGIFTAVHKLVTVRTYIDFPVLQGLN